MNETKSIFRGAILCLAILTSAGTARAQFSYNAGVGQYGDLLVCFRPASGTYDLVVDAGPVTAFINLPIGQKITVNPTYYNGAQLAYVGTNNIFFSALACQRLPGAHATNNLWVTRARSSLNTQSTPWPCRNAATAGTAASQIDSIGSDAANITLGGDPFGSSPASGSSYVVEPEGGSTGSGSYFDSYNYLMTTAGNLGGTFWGDSGGISLEQGTPANFTTAGQPVRADFYQLLSTNAIANPTNNQAGTYLGYFELATNGVLTYTAGPSPSTVIAPRIVSIVRTGTTNTIAFTTGSSGTYTLRGTNSLASGTGVTNWPPIGSSLAGNGLTNSLKEVTTDSPRFYTITAQ